MENKFETEEELLVPVALTEEKEPQDAELDEDGDDASYEEDEEFDEEDLTEEDEETEEEDGEA